MEEKVCSRCGELKPLEMFCKSKQIKSGYTAHCKACRAIEARKSVERVRARDPEAFNKRQREYVARYKKNHPDRVARKDWEYALKNRFGIDAARYDEILESQQGCCAGCGVRPKNKRLAIDHDRACCPGNKSCGNCIRGLLCSNCNTALGLLKENEETMKRLVEYIKNG